MVHASLEDTHSQEVWHADGAGTRQALALRFHGLDGKRLLELRLLVADHYGDVARLVSRLHGNDELAAEQMHVGLGEHFERRGITVADSLERACTPHLHIDVVGGRGQFGACLSTRLTVM